MLRLRDIIHLVSFYRADSVIVTHPSITDGGLWRPMPSCSFLIKRKHGTAVSALKTAYQSRAGLGNTGQSRAGLRNTGQSRGTSQMTRGMFSVDFDQSLREAVRVFLFSSGEDCLLGHRGRQEPSGPSVLWVSK